MVISQIKKRLFTNVAARLWPRYRGATLKGRGYKSRNYIQKDKGGRKL